LDMCSMTFSAAKLSRPATKENGGRLVIFQGLDSGFGVHHSTTAQVRIHKQWLHDDDVEAQSRLC
jgi:hypothetical protein